MDLGGPRTDLKALQETREGLRGGREGLRGSLKGLKSELGTSGGSVKEKNNGAITRTSSA